jgi:hypothetical protein
VIAVDCLKRANADPSLVAAATEFRMTERGVGLVISHPSDKNKNVAWMGHGEDRSLVVAATGFRMTE